jgi:hypothetical protein
MPSCLGKSQQERDINKVAIAEGLAIFLACAGLALALVVIGLLERAPA